jgi:hypothetical protein
MSKAFGATAGTSKNQPATPAREGNGANSQGEAPAGGKPDGVPSKGFGSSKKGFGA